MNHCFSGIKYYTGLAYGNFSENGAIRKSLPVEWENWKIWAWPATHIINAPPD
jgi:hypothetical protein